MVGNPRWEAVKVEHRAWLPAKEAVAVSNLKR